MEVSNPVNTTVPKWGSPEWKEYYAKLQASKTTTPSANTSYGPFRASYTVGGKAVGLGNLARKSRKSNARKSRKRNARKSRKSKSRK